MTSAGLSRHGTDCECRRCRGFEKGNRPANFASGATSEHALAPIRRELEPAIAADYPTLDARRRALLAELLAQVDLATRWLDEHGIMRDGRGRKGEVWDLVDRRERWMKRAWSILAELEGEAPREPSLVLVMQEQAALGHGRAVVDLDPTDAAKEPPGA